MALIDEILADTPAGVWKLNEPTGSTTVADSSGNGITGTVVLNQPAILAFGGSSLLPGVYPDTSLYMSANELGLLQAYIDLGNQWSALTAFTIEKIYTYPTFGGASGDIAKANAWFLGSDGAGHEGFGCYTPSFGSVVNTTSLVAGQAYHMVGRYDGVDMRIFLDGALDCTPVAKTGTTPTNTNTAKIGEWDDSTEKPRQQSYQYVAFYTYALSPTRIAAHAAAAHLIPTYANPTPRQSFPSGHLGPF